MMWRTATLLLAVQAVLALSEPLDDGTLPAAEGDDECLMAGEGGCALNALQRRGAKLSAPEAEQEESEEGEDEELELLEGEDFEDEDPETEEVQAESTSGLSKGPDMSRKDEAQMLHRLSKHTRKIKGLQKKMDAVEKKVNETYVMTMQELSGRANATVEPPPMQSKHASKGHKHHAAVGGRRRRRHHAAAVKLPPKMKKVEVKVQACEKALKTIMNRVKRSGDILVFTRKRITGGEIALAQEDEEEEALGADADPEDDEAEALESGDGELHVQMSRDDLDLQVKSFNTEIYDINNVIKDLGKREAQTRKLFMDTFRVE